MGREGGSERFVPDGCNRWCLGLNPLLLPAQSPARTIQIQLGVSEAIPTDARCILDYIGYTAGVSTGELHNICCAALQLRSCIVGSCIDALLGSWILQERFIQCCA